MAIIKSVSWLSIQKEMLLNIRSSFANIRSFFYTQFIKEKSVKLLLHPLCVSILKTYMIVCTYIVWVCVTGDAWVTIPVQENVWLYDWLSPMHRVSSLLRLRALSIWEISTFNAAMFEEVFTDTLCTDFLYFRISFLPRTNKIVNARVRVTTSGIDDGLNFNFKALAPFLFLGL